jgi:dynein heavy chain
MLIGPTGGGKSWLGREGVYNHIPKVSAKYQISSLCFSNNTNAEKAQYFIDSKLERRRKGVYGPPFGKRFLIFIDDLMMPAKDEYGVQSANELIRQWFDFNGWYDHRSLELKRVEDIQFLSCMTTYGKQIFFNQI